MNASSPTSPAAGGQPVVACQRLGKVFRDFWMRPRVRAVEDLTFEIRPHEVFGLLGPNGSGKSTTIKMILGLLHPSRGRLLVFGKAPSDVAIKARIGYLPEESFLYPFLNARETLEYYAKLFEIDGKTRKRRIDELLDMVGLAAAQHRPVREYSKGMQRRIGLAQALINDPDFLILDEPTTGLDPIGTRQVKDLIIELGSRGKTVLLSSHLLADVEDVVDRMVILYGGKKRDEGTTDSLLTTHSKTTIETDALDDDTIAEIDRIIRERSSGERSVLRVSHPRQKLEEKFLDIVERARQDRVETSGADNRGGTAAFLASGAAAPPPEDLIAGLVAGDQTEELSEPGDAPSATAGAGDSPDASSDAEADRAAGQDDADAVLAALTEQEPAAQPSVETNTDPSPASPPSTQPSHQPVAEEKKAGGTPTAKPAAPAPHRDAPDSGPATSDEVDRGMIDSLLGGGSGGGGDDEPATGPERDR
ncbi:MAG: ATP-binding cassette domain-containing protein [Planctomycetota bacterium]